MKFFVLRSGACTLAVLGGALVVPGCTTDLVSSDLRAKPKPGADPDAGSEPGAGGSGGSPESPEPPGGAGGGGGESGSSPDAGAEGGAASSGGAGGAPEPGCGNGIVEDGELCDEMVATQDCDDDCTFRVCGDGQTNETAGEQCDPGGATVECTKNCEVATCPPGCRCEQRDTSQYLYCEDLLSFADSAAKCEEFGGRLAAIETPAENRFLVTRSLGVLYGIGGTDSVAEGQWLWPTGEAFWSGDAAGAAEPGSFAAWHEAEPNDGAGNEDCVELWSHQPAETWNDISCIVTRNYICELAREVPATCGNSAVEQGEACDDGEASTECDTDCSLPVCGDGLLNVVSGEECDDGNASDLDACDASCQDTGLVAHWPLLEERGVRFRNYVSPLDFQPVGFEVADTPLPEFDGMADYLVFPAADNPEELNITGDMSVSLMAKFGPDTGGFRPLVVHGLESTSHLYIAIRDGMLEAGMRDVGTDPVRVEQTKTPAAAMAGDGEWHHLVLRFGGGDWTLFVDGEVRASEQGGVGPSSVNASWGVGGFPDGSGPKFAGSLRSVRIYSRALSEKQVRDLGSSD